MDESVKTQQLLISYAMQKGGWRNMPLPSDWMQITISNAILYVNKTGHTILDVHPFKYLALGNDKEKRLVKKTIAHQSHPQKKNQSYISCWATCPFPEPHWLKLYHITKHSIIYYHSPSNTLTAKHPCRNPKKTQPKSPIPHTSQNPKQRSVKSPKNKRKNARKRATTYDNLNSPISPLPPPIITSPNSVKKRAKSQKKIATLSKKKKRTPSTPPPRMSPINAKSPNHSFSLNVIKDKKKKNRRTKSSFENTKNQNPKTKPKKSPKLKSKNKNTKHSKSKSAKEIRHRSKTNQFKGRKSLSEKTKNISLSKLSKSRKKKTKDLKIEIKQNRRQSRKSKSVKFAMDSTEEKVPNSTLSPASFSNEDFSELRKISLENANIKRQNRTKSPTPNTRKLIKKSNKKRFKSENKAVKVKNKSKIIKKKKVKFAEHSQNKSSPKRKARSLSNHFHSGHTIDGTPRTDTDNTVLNGQRYKFDQLGSSYKIQKSVYMYAASRGNNVLFPVNKSTDPNTKIRKRKSSIPHNRYKKKGSKARSNSLSKGSDTKHSKISHQKRRRNAVGVSVDISKLKFDDSILGKSEIKTKPKMSNAKTVPTLSKDRLQSPTALERVRSDPTTPTTPTLLAQSTSTDGMAESPNAMPHMSLSKSAPKPVHPKVKNGVYKHMKTDNDNDSDASDLDIDENVNKSEIKSNINTHNSDEESNHKTIIKSLSHSHIPHTPTPRNSLSHGRGRRRNRSNHRKSSRASSVSSTNSSLSRKSSISQDKERRESVSVSMSDSDSSDGSSISSVSDSDTNSDSSDSLSSNSSNYSNHSHTHRRSRTDSRGSRSRSTTPSRYRAGSRGDSIGKLQDSLFNNMANMMSMMQNTPMFMNKTGGNGSGDNFDEFMTFMNNFNGGNSASNPRMFEGYKMNGIQSIMLTNSYADDTSCSASDNDSPTKSSGI